MGRGEYHQAIESSGRWDAWWTLAQWHEPRTFAGTGLWTAVGGGKLLQRPETNDGSGLERTPDRSDAGRSQFPGSGLRPPPLGEAIAARMFSTEQRFIHRSSSLLFILGKMEVCHS